MISRRALAFCLLSFLYFPLHFCNWHIIVTKLPHFVCSKPFTGTVQLQKETSVDYMGQPIYRQLIPTSCLLEFGN